MVIFHSQIWAPTDADPADHPSRSKEIPPPEPGVPDPLLSPEISRGVQVRRSPAVQCLLEQESQKVDSEPVVESVRAHEIDEALTEKAGCVTVTNKSADPSAEANAEASCGSDRKTWTFREIDLQEKQD